MPHPMLVELERPKRSPFWRSTAGIATLGFAAMGVLLLITEHRGHVLGILPFAFVLACPLMHFFMHRGHAHPQGSGKSTSQQEDLP